MTKTTGPSDDPSFSRKNRSWIGLASLGTVLGLAVAVLLQFQTNFHAVLPGLVYRSGQLDPVTLATIIERHRLHTIINLRGPCPESDWYQEERAVARHHHIHYIDFPIDSTTSLHPGNLRQLLDILATKDAAPILIHCQSGIDRSGSMALGCALLLDEVKGLESAQNQLQWRYGNLPWFRSTKDNQDYLDHYKQWLKRNGLNHSAEHFCQWAFTVDHSHS